MKPLDILQYLFGDLSNDPFIIRIVLCLLLAGFSCSLLSPLVIVRRLSTAGIGIGIAALTGAFMGLAFWPSYHATDWPILAVAGGSAGIIAIVVLMLNQHSIISVEALLGVLATGAMALGVFTVFEWGLEIPDLSFYLFKTPNVTTSVDFFLLFGLATLLSLTFLFYFRPLTALCIDRTYAQAMGIRIRYYEWLSVFLLTAVILTGIYTAGLLFTFTLLILPGACARILTVRLAWMTIYSIGLGLLSCLASIILSQRILDAPPSIVLAAIQLTLFLVFYVVYRIASRKTLRLP